MRKITKAILKAVVITVTTCLITACTSNSVNTESLDNEKYSVMSGTEEIFGWAQDLVNMGACRPGTENGKKA